MRIPLFIEKDLLVVNTTVRIPKWRVFGYVKFYVDTGSPKSFISEQDAMRLQIPSQKINFNDRAMMGGTSISIGNIDTNLTIYFKTEKESVPIKLSKFCVSKGMWSKKGIIVPNPSILGNDFLLENKILLYHHPSKGVSYLEKE